VVTERQFKKKALATPWVAACDNDNLEKKPLWTPQVVNN